MEPRLTTPWFLGAASILWGSAHLIVVPKAGPLAELSLMALKCLVKTKVVPLLSPRLTRRDFSRFEENRGRGRSPPR